MVSASDLRPGMALRIEKDTYKVLEVDVKAGAAKMGGVVVAKLRNVLSGRLWEQHFRPQERLEDVELEQHMMEFLYSAGDSCTLMRPDTFEQVSVPLETLGFAAQFLTPGMQLPVEFFKGEAINVVVPDFAEARVASTAPPARSQHDSAWKEAVLENGVTVRVPLFVASGETIRIDLRTGHYVERIRAEKKKSA